MTVDRTYPAGGVRRHLRDSTVQLPDDRTWNDVSDWYVKWDTLYPTFKDGKEAGISIDSDTMNIIDGKRPTRERGWNTMKEFYLDIDKSTPNWTYSLRLRRYSEQSIGVQIATFNPYTLAQNPGLAQGVVNTLNEKLAEKVL